MLKRKRRNKVSASKILWLKRQEVKGNSVHFNRNGDERV